MSTIAFFCKPDNEIILQPICVAVCLWWSLWWSNWFDFFFFIIFRSDLAKLSYLTQCIKESMRMYPPVTFVQRVTTKDTMLDGHPIPSGTTIGIQIYNLHHNKAVWDDPYTYKPERFSSEKERNEKNETFAFVPFSAGPRYIVWPDVFIILSRDVKLTVNFRPVDMTLNAHFWSNWSATWGTENCHKWNQLELLRSFSDFMSDVEVDSRVEDIV